MYRNSWDKGCMADVKEQLGQGVHGRCIGTVGPRGAWQMYRNNWANGVHGRCKGTIGTMGCMADV